MYSVGFPVSCMESLILKFWERLVVYETVEDWKGPCVGLLSRVWLSATPWIAACRAPLSLRVCRQQYWSGLLFPTPGDLPDPGVKPTASASPLLVTSVRLFYDPMNFEPSRLLCLSDFLLNWQANSLSLCLLGSPGVFQDHFLVCAVPSCLSHVWLFVTPPGSCVHGTLQAVILEWVAMPSSRGSSRPRDRTQVSPIAGGFFVIWVTREALLLANKVNHNASHHSVHRTIASMAILHAVSPSHDTTGKPFAFTWWVHKYIGYHLCAVLCLVNQSCPTFCDPVDCSPGSSVLGILQARILEWVAVPSSRASSQPRDRTQVSRIAGGFFYLQSHQGSPERVRLVFNGSLWFSLMGEGARWTGNALLVALSCWPFRHLSVCDAA